MALYGVEHYLPETVRLLRLARRLLKGWTNLRPPQSHNPISYGLAGLIAIGLSGRGYRGATIGGLLGFDC